MDERRNLHDGEMLLCARRPSAAAVAWGFVWAVVDAAIVSLLLYVLIGAVLWFTSETFSPWWVVPLVAVPAYALAAYRRRHHWQKALLRITTERILLQFPGSFFSHFQKTLKWNQYQESYVGKAGIFSILLRSRPLCIRYGSSDGEQLICFPAIRNATDIKHYLDKVDSAVRKNQTDTVKPFVDKPRGQRD